MYRVKKFLGLSDGEVRPGIFLELEYALNFGLTVILDLCSCTDIHTEIHTDRQRDRQTNDMTIDRKTYT